MMSLQEWARFLDSPTLSVLPHDFQRPHDGKYVEARVAFPKVDSLATLCEDFQATEFSIKLAIFAALVFRLTGDDDIVICTDSEDGREFVVRVPVESATKFKDLVQNVDKQYNLAVNSSNLPSINEISHEIQKEKKLDKLPNLFKLRFQHKVHSLDCDLVIVPGSAIYNSLLFTEDRIAILGEQFKQFADLVSGEKSVSEISLVTPSQRLPDPTCDLDWKGYRGAIQDIFSANAAKFPDRACVVETGATGKTYSYKQIDECSNVVGHYLKSEGVKRGDVVTVYAYRGVDLVVAVMGVLKAGCVFSVIDPAYPAERQKVYLKVAQPRGLIVLSKAGTLHESVKAYADIELDVLAFLPGMEMVQGGVIGSQKDDPLTPFQHLKDEPVGVEVGPDSNPTLAFTSGSEGLPKGVLGRHFSLAYYFPWMSERFGLSEKDRFTMLSGIAHDPIQRDMFTPLFLGATLLVPTQEDIGTPGQLAQWMAGHGATVTHLTPAMGQLLAAQAESEIPSLHHAFFVGDILTKRDCVRLQTLARNCNIVNMYGTTETQRSVSYFEVSSRSRDPSFLESQKDIMPAGKGMKNVQLLVINKDNQLCGVGEVGEIYVRAAGLAEGYRFNDELNAKKFVTNWFTSMPSPDSASPLWKGPRDRLYRTGDLGRYAPDGNCECCGRADDQVKIRGFRIELGEIDTHLSQHPAVRENCTVVKKGDDPFLVSYIVPKQKVSDVRSLVKDIQAFLKKRLASYAVPAVIIPLDKFPLNPNGKIDKPKLPAPEPVAMDALEESLSETELLIRDLWLSVLPHVSSISKKDSFFDVGGHSILATRMIFELRKKLNLDLPLGVIFTYPTIELFAQHIDNLRMNQVTQPVKTDNYYSQDAKSLVGTLPESFPTGALPNVPVVLLTGATGFLGSFILKDLLCRGFHVYAHVRANSPEAGLDRLRKAGTVYGTWDDSLSSQIHPVLGDLSKPQFGMAPQEWDHLVQCVDVIIHNAALVHWVYPYSKLRDANVISTVNLLQLCSVGKPKFFTFVSSTSTLDTDHFFSLSDSLVKQGKSGIPESDPLTGSATGLTGGYGQSKWAAEHITLAAGSRGLQGCIVRPGYVCGSSTSGSSNTDDFLLRMLKGCVELGSLPDIANTVNMVPVNHVARVAVACALYPPQQDHLAVAHVTAHPRMRFNQFLLAAAAYGYDVKQVSYSDWKAALEKYVFQDENESALFPLLHMVLGNLPEGTLAPELDDSNAVISLKKDAAATGQDFSQGMGVDVAQMGVYIAYLRRVGFLPPPTKSGLPLPEISISKETLELVASGAGARSSAA